MVRFRREISIASILVCALVSVNLPRVMGAFSAVVVAGLVAIMTAMLVLRVNRCPPGQL